MADQHFSFITKFYYKKVVITNITTTTTTYQVLHNGSVPPFTN